MELEIQLFDRNLIKLCLASTSDFFEIKHFLKQHKESSASRNDLIYTVRYQTKLIGLARLIPVRGAIKPRYWLRGLFLETDFRQQRLATHLLDFMTSDFLMIRQPPRSTLFPYVHLKQFYKQNGFNSIDLNQLPASLQKTYQNALNQGKTWLCMEFSH